MASYRPDKGTWEKSAGIDTGLDCHMHSTFSDGSHTIDQVARSAVEKGLKTIAITDHMPLPFATRYAMDRRKLEDYRNSIQEAKTGYKDRLTILAGMEMEYLPDHCQWIRQIADMGWDLLLVSVHGIGQDHFMVNGREDEFRLTLDQVFGNDVRAFCHRYYALIQEAVSTGWFHVVGHLDVIKKHNPENRFFDETAPWYRDLVCQTLDAMARHRVKMEINTNGLNHPVNAVYPSDWVVQEAMARKIPLVLGSDAHHPRFQGQYFYRFQPGQGRFIP